jgi:hypothetical protein
MYMRMRISMSPHFCFFQQQRDAGYSLQCLRSNRYSHMTNGLPSYHKAAVDQYVAASSAVFVGRRGSSFSWMVRKMRVAKTALRTSGSDSATDDPLGGIPDPLALAHFYEALPQSPRDREGFPDFDADFGFG